MFSLIKMTCTLKVSEEWAVGKKPKVYDNIQLQHKLQMNTYRNWTNYLTISEFIDCMYIVPCNHDRNFSIELLQRWMLIMWSDVWKHSHDVTALASQCLFYPPYHYDSQQHISYYTTTSCNYIGYWKLLMLKFQSCAYCVPYNGSKVMGNMFERVGKVYVSTSTCILCCCIYNIYY